VDAFRVQWIEDGDEAGLEQAREYARSRLLDCAPIHASLECPPIRKRSRLLGVHHRDRLVGLTAVVDGILPYRSVGVCASLPGATRLLLSRVDPPFVAFATQPIWCEIARCGGRGVLEEIQMARLAGTPLPEREPGLERLERVEEIRAFLGPRFSPVHFEAGPFLGIRDSAGALLACGGVQFVTDRVAQIAYLQSREESLAPVVLAGLTRELESERRVVVLHARPDNLSSTRRYARLGFRGRVRTALFRLSQRVAGPARDSGGAATGSDRL
jgi:hypothetical protein